MLIFFKGNYCIFTLILFLVVLFICIDFSFVVRHFVVFLFFSPSSTRFSPPIRINKKTNSIYYVLPFILLLYPASSTCIQLPVLITFTTPSILIFPYIHPLLPRQTLILHGTLKTHILAAKLLSTGKKIASEKMLS